MSKLLTLWQAETFKAVSWYLVHTVASNCLARVSGSNSQLPYLNEWKKENGLRNYFMTYHYEIHMSHDTTKPTKWVCAQQRLRSDIHPVWPESSLCTQWIAKDPRFLHADSKESDQTGRMPRLIWVFAGRTVILLVLSCRGSYGWAGVQTSNLQMEVRCYQLCYWNQLHFKVYRSVNTVV